MAVGEWDQRQLCPDGACIGVIGPDGTCKVCGRAAPNWGDERNRGLIDPPEDEDDEDEDEDLASDSADEDEDDEDEDEGLASDSADEDEDDEDEDEDLASDSADEDEDEEEDEEASEPGVAAAPRGMWAARQLCPDGACIGVIDPDGRCKVCGRRASDAAAESPSSEPAAEPAAPAAASSRATPAAPTEPAAPQDHVPGTGSPGEFLAGLPAAPAGSSPATSGSEPCPTPDCSGHIGADGRCAVCGKGAS